MKIILILKRTYWFSKRFKIALKEIVNHSKSVIVWLFNSFEVANYTYDLGPLNIEYLMQTVSLITGESIETVKGYAKELTQDKELRYHIKTRILTHRLSYMADSDARFGRRMIWYLLTRIKKPKLVVETGVDKGLGSCVITAALKRNETEGHSGKYLGTDIDEGAGYLLDGKYKNFGKIIYGDSLVGLKKIKEKIDLFINDSDHSASYEKSEYDVISTKLNKGAVVIGDNCNSTDELLKFARKTKKGFAYFVERPINHWYKGAGTGIVFDRFSFS